MLCKARFRSLAIGAAALLCFAGSPLAARADLTIGGFDAARGGGRSAILGSEYAPLRASVSANFTGVTYSDSSTMTAAFLSTLDVLILSGPKDGLTWITPLTSAEQSALNSFVLDGGTAILMTDNSFTAGPTVNASFVGQFGLTTSGNFVGNQTVTTNVAHPITNGPFGDVNTLYGAYTGSYSSLGSDAISLATLDTNGADYLAVIDKGVLGPGSGVVAMFADASTVLLGGFGQADNEAAILNTIHHGAAPVPVPGAVLLGALGLGCVALPRRRRD